MSRTLAFFAALICSALAVSSACTAASAAETHRFTLEPARQQGQIHASFHRTDDRGRNTWSTSFPVSELAGLDTVRLNAAGSSPLSFAIVREAGRLDCAGNGGNSMAIGSCRFTADAAFTNFIVSRGMRRPTADQAFGLMAVNARRDIVEALSAVRYPVPTVDQLTALTAVGVSGRYIADLARVGYRPATLDALLQFKALDITPDFIEGFVRLGYANLPADELVQLKALDIGADFIAGFERLGYRRLSDDQLVQLKALDVTPEFVRSVQRDSAELPSPDRLVQMRALGYRPRSRD